MIKPTELRIGNLVQYGVEDNICEVITIQSTRIEIHSTATQFWDVYLDDEIGCEGIPLTEDWMLRLGWLKDHKKYNPSILDTITFWKSGLGLKSVIDGKRYRLRHYSDMELDVLQGINVDYVHQLQNLYLALTGEELEVKS